jgi:hypothetical protein
VVGGLQGLRGEQGDVSSRATCLSRFPCNRLQLPACNYKAYIGDPSHQVHHPPHQRMRNNSRVQVGRQGNTLTGRQAGYPVALKHNSASLSR